MCVGVVLSPLHDHRLKDITESAMSVDSDNASFESQESDFYALSTGDSIQYYIDSFTRTRAPLESLDSNLGSNTGAATAFLQFLQAAKENNILGPIVVFPTDIKRFLGEGSQFTVYTGNAMIYANRVNQLQRAGRQ